MVTGIAVCLVCLVCLVHPTLPSVPISLLHRSCAVYPGACFFCILHFCFCFFCILLVCCFLLPRKLEKQRSCAGAARLESGVRACNIACRAHRGHQTWQGVAPDNTSAPWGGRNPVWERRRPRRRALDDEILRLCHGRAAKLASGGVKPSRPEASVYSLSGAPTV